MTARVMTYIVLGNSALGLLKKLFLSQLIYLFLEESQDKADKENPGESNRSIKGDISAAPSVDITQTQHTSYNIPERRKTI